MGEYHFSVAIAQQYGLDEAIMLHNLAFWIRKNAVDGRHIHDNQVWTFCSLEAFTELFPFWSVKQIRRILKSLEDGKLIQKGNYNKRGMDRTTWYAITDEKVRAYYEIPDIKAFAQVDNSTCPDGQISLPEQANESAQTGRPIPDSKQDNKPDTLSVRVNQRDQFDTFWRKYPRKVCKKKAWEKWQKIDPDPALFTRILSGLDAHIRSNQWQRGIIPHPTTWLNGERWEDEWPTEGRKEEGGCEYV